MVRPDSHHLRLGSGCPEDGGFATSNAHALHHRQVDDKALVNAAESGSVMAAAADSDSKLVVSLRRQSRRRHLCSVRSTAAACRSYHCRAPEYGRKRSTAGRRTEILAGQEARRSSNWHGLERCVFATEGVPARGQVCTVLGPMTITVTLSFPPASSAAATRCSAGSAGFRERTRLISSSWTMSLRPSEQSSTPT
jgi:hypothetical protein